MERIACVIVTYNPDEGILKCFNSLINQVDEVFIVDNGSSQKNKSLIEKCKEGFSHKVNLIYNDDNLGIAEALNIGVKQAIDKNYKWVITMDQDSKAEEEMIKNMFDVYYSIEENKRKDIVSLFPNFIDERVQSLDSNNKNEKYEYVDAEITSGNIIKVNAFEKVGYFDESLFIDMVDTDFCMRLNEVGLKMIKINNAVLYHNLGDSQEVRTIFGKFNTCNHSALRRYYMTRNRLYTWNKYKDLNSFTLNRDKTLFKKEFIKILLGEKDKFNKVKMIYKGYKDYKKGIRGKLK